ncbi:hypothetical protein JOQ06_023143 [Pogonophryne albipinna]|uniref:Uncharacterized protein n=1 Tax=Pogonophryne albipinna TaxID=1090488 RepID=A0AAD6BJU1_9TELE|nr:hypothetical protein JOQ06_023143 [Pogonophryne albipinna]
MCASWRSVTVVVGDAERLKLLGVPAYMKGTDEPCGMIIARLTLHRSACIAIQLSLGRPLLWSGCRHHIDEVLLSHIFTDLKVKTSRSPEVTLFTRLRDNWDLVPHKDSGQLSRYIPDEAEPPFLGKLRAELIACAAGVLDYKRGDYREFVQLCLVYLGADSAAHTPVTFQRPGALHKARWMAKLLYTQAGLAAHCVASSGDHHYVAEGAEDSGPWQRHFAHLRNVVADLRHGRRCRMELPHTLPQPERVRVC